MAAAIIVGYPAAAIASGDVDDFVFESFSATYDLARDADGHSVVTVEETLVAVFPQDDQNRGIRRELVDRYDGHPTDLEVLSVEDANGNAREYETDSEDEFLVLTIAGDEFVHGRQAYVITYTQRNVTAYFENTDSEEFYWGTNGTGWNQPFGEVTATVTIADELQPSLTDEVDAAYGRAGRERPPQRSPPLPTATSSTRRNWDRGRTSPSRSGSSRERPLPATAVSGRHPGRPSPSSQPSAPLRSRSRRSSSAGDDWQMHPVAASSSPSTNRRRRACCSLRSSFTRQARRPRRKFSNSLSQATCASSTSRPARARCR